MKKLLLLGGSRYLLPVIKKAHDLGIYVITCDYLPDNIAHCYSDEYHNVSIVNQDEVLALAKKLGINGIMSFATDPGVIIAAYVAEQLGLPTPPYESVRILQNKDLFRSFLHDHHFQVPFFASYSDKTAALQALSKLPFPVIVKPVDSAGSKGVTRVDDKEHFEGALSRAFEESRAGRIIVEEFIDKIGCSSDTDCFSINDELVFTSFNCQYFDVDATNPYTPAAFLWPSDMPSSSQRELKDELQRLIRLLHLGTSIYNVETRLGVNNKAYIMEVSPRGGGNRLAEMLEKATGQDLITQNIRAAVGETLIPLSNPVYDGFWAEIILHSQRAGRFKGIDISPRFEKNYVVEKDLWISEGTFVQDFTGANQAIGTLVLRFATMEEAREQMACVNNKIHVLIA